MEFDYPQSNDDLPYLPHNYKVDDEIPFAPDGNAPLISNSIEKVKGTSGLFQGLKCVRKTIFVAPETDSRLQDTHKRRLAQEAKILYLARHQHVVRLFHTYFEEESDDQIKFAVVMDRADASLQDYIRPGKSPNTEWFGCLLKAVHHVHTLGIRHRDIKPSNVLIKGEKILLADFGISQMGLGKTMPTTYEHRNASRSREYCAPEVDEGSTRENCSDRFEELNKILKPQSQQPSSYAKHVDEVRGWIEDELKLNGGYHGLLHWCQRMLHPERHKRPTAEEINSALPPQSVMRCHCVGDEVVDECTRLIEACKRGLYKKVKRLLSKGADPNTMGAIHHAAERGSRLSIQALLDAGALIDSRNAVEQTALQCAARNGFDSVVKQLLKNNADVNAKDENGQTALHGAAAQGYGNIVRLLLYFKAAVDAEDLDGHMAVHFAARRRHYAILEVLERFAEEGQLDDSYEVQAWLAEEKPISERDSQLSSDEEDSDDATSIASVESDQNSIFSTAESRSSVSSVDFTTSGVTDVFAELFLKDEELLSYIKEAPNRMTSEKFVRNQRRLLKRFYLDLCSQAHDNIQIEAIRHLQRRRNRVEIARKIYGIISQNQLEGPQLRAQSQVKEDMIARMLQERVNLTDDEMTPGTAKSGDVSRSHEEISDDSDSDSPDESDNEEETNRAREVRMDILQTSKAFIFTGIAFDLYKIKVRQFVQPSSSRLRPGLGTDIVGYQPDRWTMSEVLRCFRSYFPCRSQPVQSPCTEGHVRVTWKCICGEELFDDYVEVTEGAAAILERRLRQTSKRPSRIQQSWFADWRSRLPSLFSITTAATNEQSNSHSRGSLLSANQGSAGSPSNSNFSSKAGPGNGVRQSRDISSKQNQSPGEKRTIGYQMPSTPDLYILTCANEARDTVKLTHVGLSRQDISNDSDLAFALKAHWSWLNKMWYRFFRFKGLTSIEFVKFYLHTNRFADIQDCPAVPPIASTSNSLQLQGNHSSVTSPRNIDLTYEFLRTDLLPPLGSNYLLHLLKHPDEYQGERVAFSSIPKRKIKLPLGVGWGIHLVEQIQMWKIWLACIVFLFLGALAFGVAWTLHKHDIGGGFGVASFITALGPLVAAFAEAYLG